MEQVKFYSSKSNAKRAAAKAGVNLETAVLIEGEGGFAYTAPQAPEVDPMDQQFIDQCGHSHCPSCGIHLNNGLMDFDSVVEATGSFKKAFAEQQHQWSCMGCGAEWGEEIIDAPQPAQASTATGTGTKIEKNREERNGVKRPSAGGACRAVWDVCDALMADGGKAPSAKEVKETAATLGWNANNASIEYYLWRKFMGIRGRQPK